MDSSTLFMRILGTLLFGEAAIEAVRGLGAANRERGPRQIVLPIIASLLLGLSQEGTPLLTPIGLAQFVGWLPAWCSVAITRARRWRHSGLPDTSGDSLSYFSNSFPQETLALLETVLLAEGMAVCAMGTLSVGLPGESLTPWLLFAMAPLFVVGWAGLLLIRREKGIEWLSSGQAYPAVIALGGMAVVALPLTKFVAGRNCQLPWAAASAAFLIHAALAVSRVELRCVRPDTPAQRLVLYAPLLLFVPFELLINCIQLDAGTLFLLLVTVTVALLLIGARSAAAFLHTAAITVVGILLWFHVGIRPILRLQMFLDARGGLGAQQIASLFSQARGGLFGRGHLFLLSRGPALPLPRTDGLLSGMTEVNGAVYTLTFLGLLAVSAGWLVLGGLRSTGFPRAYTLLSGAFASYSIGVAALWQAGFAPVVGVAMPCSFGVWSGLFWAWMWGSSTALIGAAPIREHRLNHIEPLQRVRSMMWGGAAAAAALAATCLFVLHTAWVACPGRAATLSRMPNDLEAEGMIRRAIEAGWLAPNSEDPIHKPAVVLGPADGTVRHAATIRARLGAIVKARLVSAVSDPRGQWTLHPVLPIRVIEPSGLGAVIRLAKEAAPTETYP